MGNHIILGNVDGQTNETIIAKNLTFKFVNNNNNITDDDDDDNNENKNDEKENYETFLGSSDMNPALSPSLMFSQLNHQQLQHHQQLSPPLSNQKQSFSNDSTKTDADRNVPFSFPGTTNFVCPVPFGRFRYELCEYYFLCFFGYPFLIKCHPVKKFDTRVKYCVPWQQAFCQDIILPIGPPAPIPPGEPPMLPSIISQPIRPPPIRQPTNGFFKPISPIQQQFPNMPQMPQFPQYPRPPFNPSMPGMINGLPSMAGMPNGLPPMTGMPNGLPSMPGMPNGFSPMSGMPNGLPSMPIPQVPTISGIPMLSGIMKDQQPMMDDLNEDQLNGDQPEFPMNIGNNQVYGGPGQCPPSSNSERMGKKLAIINTSDVSNSNNNNNNKTNLQDRTFDLFSNDNNLIWC
uniref:Pre-mRNA polyadenylation factor FIP1-like n=1 Tax=Dermatophagoides pteronyssinus TaxID=6956 RepID=A0A6P6XYV0_DERPT|nr:pre-mRNA polyadenylation factor FIP1-like [Dermatophagoides pteronyssinus]